MKYNGLKNPSIWVQLLLAGLLAIICSFTIMVMWGWFIVPLGLPAINIVQACGIDLLVSFIITTEPPKELSFWERWTYATVYAIMTLLCGWVLHFAV